MQHPIRFFAAAAVGSLLAGATASGLDVDSEPDRIVLRDGRQVRGLVVQKRPDSVTLQTRYGEQTFPNSAIARILDEGKSVEYFTELHREGSLPPWRVVVNDLRHNDLIRTFEQIPATVIGEGDFRNVPYLSFRINGDLELNIYGDPEDPAGIEIGIYGKRQRSDRLRRICREFVASYLTTRDEIATLYALDKRGDRRTAGNMVIEITPPNAPDAYGAWWLSVFCPQGIAQARLSDAEYARLTVPMDEIVDGRGMLLEDGWGQGDIDDAVSQGRDASRTARAFARGFYRDENGVFRLIQ